MTSTQRQSVVFGALLVAKAVLAFLGFALWLMDDLPGAAELPEPFASMTKWRLGLANAEIVLVAYGRASVMLSPANELSMVYGLRVWPVSRSSAGVVRHRVTIRRNRTLFVNPLATATYNDVFES